MRRRCSPRRRWHNSFCHEGPGRRNSDTISSRIVADTPTGQLKKWRPDLWSWILEAKVVVIGGKQSVGRAIAEAVAREGADVVIWLRKCINEVNEAKVLPITQLEVPSQLPNGTAPPSLWRQTIRHKSYW